MSILVMTAVFRHSETTGNDRLVLLALADNADDDTWTCWPSVPTIGRKARTSRSTTLRCLSRLEEGGHLSVERGGGRSSNRYTVLRPWAEPEGCQSDTGRGGPDPSQPDTAAVSSGDASGATDDTAAVSLVTPESSLEPSREPSGNPALAEASEVPDAAARAVVDRHWDRCKAQGIPTPTLPGRGAGNPYMALVKIVAQLLEAGWTQREVYGALADTAAYTTDAITFALRQRSGLAQRPTGTGDTLAAIADHLDRTRAREAATDPHPLALPAASYEHEEIEQLG